DDRDRWPAEGLGCGGCADRGRLDAAAGGSLGGLAASGVAGGGGMSERSRVVTLVDRGGSGKGRGGGGDGGAPADDDWKRVLTRTRQGDVEGSLHNIITIL